MNKRLLTLASLFGSLFTLRDHRVPMLPSGGVSQAHHATHPKAKEEILQEANDTSR